MRHDTDPRNGWKRVHRVGFGMLGLPTAAVFTAIALLLLWLFSGDGLLLGDGSIGFTKVAVLAWALFIPFQEISVLHRRFTGRNRCRKTPRGIEIRRYLLGDLFLARILIVATSLVLVSVDILVSGIGTYVHSSNPRAVSIPVGAAMLWIIAALCIPHFISFPPWKRHIVLTPQALIITAGKRELARAPWEDIERIDPDDIWGTLILRGEALRPTRGRLSKLFVGNHATVFLKGCSVEPNQLEHVIRTLHQQPELRPILSTEQGVVWIESGPAWSEIKHCPVMARDEAPAR